MKRLVAVLVFGLIASTPAFAFRCGTKLVSKGDTRDQVATKCGEPTEVMKLTSIFRRPTIWANGRPYYLGEDFVEVPVEGWVYNLGPNKLMRKVIFEDGVVSDIVTLGYGYNAR
jgi:Protein of unknown function (DUF2845)